MDRQEICQVRRLACVAADFYPWARQEVRQMDRQEIRQEVLQKIRQEICQVRRLSTARRSAKVSGTYCSHCP